MLDVTIPANDGREVRMDRCNRTGKLHQLLLDQPGFLLPVLLPPGIRDSKPGVEIFWGNQLNPNDPRHEFLRGDTGRWK